MDYPRNTSGLNSAAMADKFPSDPPPPDDDESLDDTAHFDGENFSPLNDGSSTEELDRESRTASSLGDTDVSRTMSTDTVRRTTIPLTLAELDAYGPIGSIARTARELDMANLGPEYQLHQDSVSGLWTVVRGPIPAKAASVSEKSESLAALANRWVTRAVKIMRKNFSRNLQRWLCPLRRNRPSCLRTVGWVTRLIFPMMQLPLPLRTPLSWHCLGH